MSILIAIDPGIVSGYAVLAVDSQLNQPKLLLSGDVNTRGFESFTRMFESIAYQFIQSLRLVPGRRFYGVKNAKITKELGKGLRRTFGPIGDVAIEDQYLDRGSKENVDTLKKLARNAGRWEEAAAATCGLHVRWIPPISWITKELGKGLRRRQIEKMAREKVNALYGESDRSEHQNAAILIGRYAAMQLIWCGR